MATRSGKAGAAEAGAGNSGGSNPAPASPAVSPRSVAISAAGVRTGEDFANLMSALMSDIIEERISPNVANAAVNAGGKLLKVVEMQYRYGQSAKQEKVLTLATGG